MDPAHITRDDLPRWYVMRDLKRPNAKVRAWQALADKGFDVFTPTRWQVNEVAGRRERHEVPYVPDLLFVRSTRAALDPEVEATATLQYRFVRGAAQYTALTVREAEMQRFMMAARATSTPQYFLPDELTPSMLGRLVRIVGGPLDGITGRLLSVRGLRRRKLLVELPGLITAAVEVAPEFIQLV